METLRLRRIQIPSRVQRLLETFVSRGQQLPKHCYQLRDPKALSGPLRAILTRALQDGHVWTCWASSFHTWLFTCEMSLPLSRERGAPVLRVNRYNETGELTEVGAWTPDRDGHWVRCAE